MKKYIVPILAFLLAAFNFWQSMASASKETLLEVTSSAGITERYEISPAEILILRATLLGAKGKELSESNKTELESIYSSIHQLLEPKKEIEENLSVDFVTRKIQISVILAAINPNVLFPVIIGIFGIFDTRKKTI